MKKRRPTNTHKVSGVTRKKLQRRRKIVSRVKRAQSKAPKAKKHRLRKPKLPVSPLSKRTSANAIAPILPARRRASRRDALSFISQSLDTRWNEYLTSLKRFQKVASVKNVHDLRVSSRRLTTTIDLIDRFNPDNMLRQARSKLKQQLSELSVLRDVHVEMVGIRGFLKQLPEMKGFYAELRGRERKCLKSVTKIAWKSDCRFIENAVNRAKIRLNARRATTREENSRKIIETALDVSFDNLSKKLESVTPTDYASIHRVRLAFKPVRYTLEMLQPLLGLDSKKLRTAALLARSMGQIQDLEVLMKDLVEFKWRKESVLGAVTEIWLDLERRKTEATQRYLRSIPKFGNIWKPIIHEHTGVTPAPSKTLLILRHGIAVARGDPAYPLDSDRPLTPKGVRRMRRIANGMRRSKVGFDVILTSPYRRALETAFIVGREYSVGQTIQTMSGLRPEVLPAEAIRALQERYSPYRRLLLVGHEPQLSAMVSTLTTGSASARPLLKKGSLCKLEVERLQIGKCAKLLWLLTPRQLINSA